MEEQETQQDTPTKTPNGLTLEARVGMAAVILSLNIGLGAWYVWTVYQRHKTDEAIRNAPLIDDISGLEIRGGEGSQHYFKLPDGTVHMIEVLKITPEGVKVKVYDVVLPKAETGKD